MKNPQFMKNINPTFIRNHTNWSSQHVENRLETFNQSTTKINVTQFYPIEQNPQFTQEHTNPNFENFQESWKFWNSSIGIMYISCIDKNPLTISNQYTQKRQKSQILSPKILRNLNLNLNDSCMLWCNLINN